MKSGYIIPQIAFWWDTTCIYTVHQSLPFFTEVGLACETKWENGKDLKPFNSVLCTEGRGPTANNTLR